MKPTLVPSTLDPEFVPTAEDRRAAAELNRKLRLNKGLTSYVHDRNRVADEEAAMQALAEIGLLPSQVKRAEERRAPDPADGER